MKTVLEVVARLEEQTLKMSHIEGDAVTVTVSYSGGESSVTLSFWDLKAMITAMDELIKNRKLDFSKKRESYVNDDIEETQLF